MTYAHKECSLLPLYGIPCWIQSTRSFVLPRSHWEPRICRHPAIHICVHPSFGRLGICISHGSISQNSQSVCWLSMKFLKLCPTNARFVNPVSVVRPVAFSHRAWQFASVSLKLYRMNPNKALIKSIVTPFASAAGSRKVLLFCCNTGSNTRFF